MQKLLIILLCLIGLKSSIAQNIGGTVIDINNETLEAVSVYANDEIVTSTDINGSFSYTTKKFPIKLSFKKKGYEYFEKIYQKPNISTKIILYPDLSEKIELEEVAVNARTRIEKVREKAFNVGVLDTKSLSKTNLDLATAMDRISGVRVRQSGGVGSRMNFSMNGFSGKQVKFFIDGVPMENFGPAFQINNIPASLANRVEVYKGVIPVSLGTDALGGAVNIITQGYKKNSFNVSYSYGSYDTHRSTLNATFIHPKSGFIAELNAYQNYSKNNYKIDVEVADINTGQYYPKKTVKRFNDTYHNETIIPKIGFVNKPYADRLMLGITLGEFYNEIQNGARIQAVFGDWYQKGNIIMPNLFYKKDNLFLKGLNFNLKANMNLGQTQNIDTKHRRYNWIGQYIEYEGPGGESSYSKYKYKDNNGSIISILEYNIQDLHQFSLANTFYTFNREGFDEVNPNNDIYNAPQKSSKNILGLSYQYAGKDLNVSIFGKNYIQHNEHLEAYNPTGVYGDVAYRDYENTYSHLGYGIASSYFLTPSLQLKTSFEKNYRLPENEELYGNLVTIQRNVDLKPEKSYNLNFGVYYLKNLNRSHKISLEANSFYRKSKDFIRARLNKNQVMQIMDNIGEVRNLGIEGELRYTWNKLNTGFSITYQNLRNYTKYEGDSDEISSVYKDQIPNIPYLYGNANLSYQFNNLSWNKKHYIDVNYNLLYVHEFYLYWPSLGSDKLNIPEQLAHDLNLVYGFGKKLSFSFELKNIFDANIYDNFSLQKPGRSVYLKINYKIF